MLSVDKTLSKKDAIGIGRKGTIDHPQLLKAPFWTVDTLFWNVPKNSYDIYFLYSVFQKIEWKKYDESTGLPSLSKTTINNIKVNTTSYNEQNKIGQIIKLIDHAKFLQQRKIKILSKIEKTLLNSLINFQTKDKIKLSELISISKCSIDPQNTPKTLYMEYSMPAYDSNKKPNKVYGVAMHSTRLKINEPVILFNKLNVRKKRIWNIKKVPQNSVSSAEFIPLKAQTIYQDYLYYALNTDYVLYKAISLSTGSSNSQKRIVPKDLLTMKIPVPNIQQQKNIASLLDRYDSEIKNYKKKVVFLVKLKKFLLQNIFI